jgi:GGDEF domain-containing protein
VSEHSHAERLSRRIELSAEELSLLLGPDRFAPTPAHEATVQDVAADETSSVPSPVVTESVAVDAVAVPTGATRCVGDTDLVQAILSGAPNFEQLALRAIRERTGEELARIITGSAADAMVATGTGTMIDEGRAFVAPLAPDARAAWALGLKRWLDRAALVAQHAPRGHWDDPTGFPSWPRLRQQVAHRIAAARLRRESLTVSLLRIEDVELWNRRSQILLDNPFMARIATALDAAVFPGDELARLDEGGFVLVSLRESATQELAAALRAEIARLPGDGPRSLVVHVGVAAAPWDATDPDSLLELAARRAAASSNQG